MQPCLMYAFRNNCIAIPMDSLHLLHIVMLQHLIAMGFHHTALTFVRETAINYPPPPSSLPPGFDEESFILVDWWSIFYDIYQRTDYKLSENGEELAESSAQAEARAHVQAQAQLHNEFVNTQAMAYTNAQAQAQAGSQDQRQAQANAEAIHNEVLTHAEAFHARPMAYAEAPAPGHAEAPAPGHAGSQALGLPLDQTQAQSWIFANSGVATPEHGIHPMGSSSLQQHPFCDPMWASPAYISDPRHNEMNSTQDSRRVRRRVNGPENETWTGTSQPPGSEPEDLDAMLRQLGFY